MLTCNRTVVEYILSWCILKWGKSKYNENYPNLRVYKSCGNTYNIKAEYISDKNVISIYLGAILDIEELCSIVIHEYWHYLLDPIEYDNIFDDLINEMSAKKIYTIHPHENVCNFYADIYKNKCLTYVKNKYKI